MSLDRARGHAHFVSSTGRLSEIDKIKGDLMRKLAALFSLITGFMVAGSAFASHDCTAVPFLSGSYYEYNPNDLTTWADYSCWTKDSYIGLNTLWYCSPQYNGFSSTALYQHMTHTVNVGASDSGTSTWTVTFNYEFLSPNASWFDQIGVLVTVWHNGQGTNYSWTHNGTQGGVYCGSGSRSFTAVNGDTITVDFDLERSDPSSTVTLSNVHILRNAS
jgi:hypothetical protein